MQDLEKKYDRLKRQLTKVEYVCIGSINIVYTICGNDYCECSKDKTKKHGPYYSWTRKIKGKTVSKRLSEKQAKACRKFINTAIIHRLLIIHF